MKFKRIIASVLASVMVSTTALSMTASAGNYTRVSVHDPSIVKLEDGSYFIIGSHLGAARSSDLMNWTSAANSYLGSTRTTFFNNIYTDLAIPEKWSNTSANYDLSGNLWAPDIIYNPLMKKYCMYLSVNGVDWHSSIVLCTADNVEGPYSYSGTIVYSGFETNPANSANSYKNTDVQKVLGSSPDLSRYLNSSGRWNAEYGTNAIDPCTFYDEDGKLWMVYGSWFGGIYMLELDEKTGLRDYNVKYETKSNGGAVLSDAYMGVHVAGGHWVSGEGPYIEYMKDPATGKGYYYLFLSYGYFNNKGGYNMRIFRSDNPQGPYVDQNGNSAVFAQGGDNIAGNIGERLMSNYQWSCNSQPNTAQGHNSVLMDDDGKLFCIYHNKFDDNYGGHEVRVHQMIMNEDGWPTATSYEYSGETLSANGHTEEAIVGDYELIWHNPNQKFVNEQSADVEKPINITLNADGTVTGDISATWKITQSGTPYMSFTWGGVTYKGAFIVQNDESAQEVKKMTFTATGINICIWGSKKTAYVPSEDIVNKTPISNGTYTIKNLNSGLYLNADTAKNSGSAEQNNTEQIWNVTADSEGWYTLRTADGKALTVANSSSENGADILIADYNGSNSQKFRILDDGNGNMAVLSAVSDCKAGLDVYNISPDAGANICQWEYWGGNGQKFIFEPDKTPVANGTYTIKNLNSGLYLNADTAKNSGSAEQNNTEQVWNVTADSEGWYTLRTADGKALTVANSSSENGADILIADYNGSNSQKFRILDDGNGNMAVLSAVSDCKAGLDVYNISPDAGANICQWEYWGGNSQKFIFDTAENIISEPAYPQVYLVEYNENYHQIRFNWKPVSGAQNYGIAVYLAGKWRIQTQSIAGSATSYTTPKNLTAGKTYKVAIAAKVNGVWGAAEAIKHAVTVTVR